jgi:hypothetical protein
MVERCCPHSEGYSASLREGEQQVDSRVLPNPSVAPGWRQSSAFDVTVSCEDMNYADFSFGQRYCRTEKSQPVKLALLR